MGFFDKYCLKDDRTGRSESFATAEDAAQFVRMHDGYVSNAGGTRTLEALAEQGYDSHGEKQRTGLFW